MQQKLYRSRDDRMIAGVCGGIAEYLDIDPTIVRVVFALLSMGPMPGILVYLLLAVIVPEEPTQIEGWEQPAVEEKPVSE